MNERWLVPRRFKTRSNNGPDDRRNLDPAAGRTTGQLNGIMAIPDRQWVHTYDLHRCTGYKNTNSVDRPGVSGKPNICHSHVDNY